MTIIASIIVVASLTAFMYVNIMRSEDFFGTIVPVILSTVIGVIWTVGSVVVICTGNVKGGLMALVISLGMFARAYAEYKTYREAQEIYARWGGRG